MSAIDTMPDTDWWKYHNIYKSAIEIVAKMLDKVLKELKENSDAEINITENIDTLPMVVRRVSKVLLLTIWTKDDGDVWTSKNKKEILNFAVTDSNKWKVASMIATFCASHITGEIPSESELDRYIFGQSLLEDVPGPTQEDMAA